MFVSHYNPPSLIRYLCQSLGIPRRQAFQLICDGHVRVNDRVITDVTAVVSNGDCVRYDGKVVAKGKESRIVVKFYKPKNMITTMTDPKGRPCIGSICKKLGASVVPVGRLDRDTKGLILLTNDGALANALIHPRYHIPKVYEVITRVPVTKRHLDQLVTGVMLSDGLAHCIQVVLLGPTQVKLVITEGRNRMIRRMFDVLGYDIAMLKRIQIGPIDLGNLKEGQYRAVSQGEMRAILQP